MTTITHSKTGQQATIEKDKGLAKLSQDAIDTLVFDAHNPHPVSDAVCKAMGLKAI